MPGRSALSALTLLLIACDREPPAAPAPVALEAARGAGPRRLVAIGDLHGDLDAARRALRLAGAIDGRDRWVGGELVVVQVGDRIDRGDEDREVLELFDRLGAEARAAGGAVHALLGNHELMNALGDFRYVTAAGFHGYDSHAAERPDGMPPSLAGVPPFALGRLLAFRPGGGIARRLAESPVVLALGDSVFVHGGLLPSFARRGADAINRAASSFLRGEAAAPEEIVAGEESPVWTRRFSADPGPADCALARESLATVGARRMVVGHTVQDHGITPYCSGAVWAIDVGLAGVYGGNGEVLEIANGRTRPLRESPRASARDAVEGAHDVAR